MRRDYLLHANKRHIKLQIEKNIFLFKILIFFAASDLDSIRALFNEKEKELSVAVAKVDELTRQLEDLRQGQGNEPPSAPALELEKLRRELMVSL